jgi:4-amino-4-deoxy-L-arabinose transferase-like glycosyltransferase
VERYLPPLKPEGRWKPALAWSGLAWFAFVLAVHTWRHADWSPIGPLRFFELLLRELTLGPRFGRFWTAHLFKTAACGLVFIGLWRLGLRLLRRHEPGPLAHCTALGLGLGLWAYLGFLLAACGLAKPALLASITALPGLWGLLSLPKLAKNLRGATAFKPDLFETVSIVCLAACVALSYLGSANPEIYYDALVYHLAIPQEYLHSGSFTPLPFNHYSGLPLLVSMLHLWSLAAGGMYGARILNFGLAAALIWAVYAAGKELNGRRTGLLAAALLAGCPLVLYMPWFSNADSGAALFHLLCLASFWRWSRAREAGLRPLLLAGLFGGFAAASKYTAAFGLAVLCFAALALSWRAKKAAFLFGAMALLPLLPWWTKSAVQFKDPFYPYMASEFGADAAALRGLEDWKAETRDNSPGIAPLRHAAKLWSDATAGFRASAYNYAGPALLGLLPLAWAAWSLPWARAALLYSGAGVFIGLCATYITRLLLMYYPPATLALACALPLVCEKKARTLAAASLLLAATALNLYWVSSIFLLSSMRGLSVATGRFTPGEYLKEPRNFYPHPTFGSYERLADLGLPKGAKVLVVGESRAFYCPLPAIISAPHDTPVLFAWARGAKTPEELLSKLDSLGVRALVYNPRAERKTVLPGYHTEEVTRLIVSMLDRFFPLVYEDKYTRAYLRSPQ